MPDVVIAAHLRYLELCGQAPGSVYCRRRALARMAAALPVPLLDASEQDLAGWRERLTVGPGTVVGYVSHAREFYAWAMAAGLIYVNPAEAGIGATLHQLRHRFGTQTYARRRDLRMVQELLGHASPATTAVYTLVDQADAAVVVDELPVPGRLKVVGQ
jgi:Phage integrase family